MLEGRWTLLIVRDLLAGPKRFRELQEGLPGIPTNVLTARLRELEDADIVSRRILPRGVGYDLTAYGRELEDPLVRLGLWGAKKLETREDSFFSMHSLALGLRGAFRPDKAQSRDGDYELRIDGQTLHVSVIDNRASFASDSNTEPDVVMETDPDGIYQLLTGMLTLAQAVAAGRVRITGSSRAANRFFQIFRLPPQTEPPDRADSQATTTIRTRRSGTFT